MNTITKKIDNWESAWGEYIDAVENVDQCRPLRRQRGHMRAWTSALVRCRNAVAKLRKLDSEFCDRMGIK